MAPLGHPAQQAARHIPGNSVSWTLERGVRWQRRGGGGLFANNRQYTIIYSNSGRGGMKRSIYEIKQYIFYTHNYKDYKQ